MKVGFASDEPYDPAQEMVVTRILEGGTAHKTRQLLTGDVIVSIDGIVTRGWDLPKVRVRAGGPRPQSAGISMLANWVTLALGDS